MRCTGVRSRQSVQCVAVVLRVEENPHKPAVFFDTLADVCDNDVRVPVQQTNAPATCLKVRVPATT